MTLVLWIGVVLCLSESAMLSGLNLVFFTINKLEVQMEEAKGNKHSRRVLGLRKDANFFLVTILWANVAMDYLCFVRRISFTISGCPSTSPS